MWKPELLAPAKNLERLKVAVTYGADAVYVGGQRYGLRARADNFTDLDLERGIAFAHQHQARVYVTLNAFLHDEDFEGLAEYCQFLESIGLDAVIVSDLGVLRVVQRSSNLDIHLSTQASCLNAAAGQFWKNWNVKRLIVGRELSVEETAAISVASGIEAEMFVHGAMCMAYSGQCTISNFTAGRDSNRGGCVQSCRFPYSIQATGETQSLAMTPSLVTAPQTVEAPTFMSSKDLWGIGQIPAFFEHRICSLKIEGRMKSSFYVAMTCRAYRQAIDAYAEGQLTPDLLNQIAAELESIPHRDYTEGSLETPADLTSVYEQTQAKNVGTHEYVGMVIEATARDLFLYLCEPLSLGDEIEFVPPIGQPILSRVHQLLSIKGEGLSTMRQDGIVRVPKDEKLDAIQTFTVVRAATVRIDASKLAAVQS